MKVNRLLGIVVLLLNRRRMTAKDLAEYFEVSQRTILRDVESLCQAGIPLCTLQGSGGGIQLMEEFTLERQILTDTELASVVTALSGAARLFQDSAYRNAGEKIRNLAAGPAFEAMYRRTSMVSVDMAPWNYSPQEKAKASLIQQALEANRTVRFCYASTRGETLEREVEPARLVFKGNAWYVLGYCLLRNAPRVFRLTRASDIQLGATVCSEHSEIDYDSLLESDTANTQSAVHLSLRFSADVRYRVIDEFPQDQYTEQGDGSLWVQTTYPPGNWIWQYLLSFGSSLEVLSPPWLRTKLAAEAEKIINKYRT